MGEYLKHCRHLGLARGLYFWRDHTGNEVDLLIDRAGDLWPVEMKSGATFQPEWLKGLQTFAKHAAAAPRGTPMLISDVPGTGLHRDTMLAHWRDALETLGAAPAD